ncbi:hypothetical protein CLOLEP_02763 [[Clostridium] leptum DSM 753]|uniref:Uncharacterized protein n=1 Tax=[Clostridium] leptum DSM 753 TaxID=428125 RepID=A7VVZ9_9FIRM|nr:hypothetical protein CLOLEP_02763 [[Clostridium] leptum DSM 753]
MAAIQICLAHADVFNILVQGEQQGLPAQPARKVLQELPAPQEPLGRRALQVLRDWV